MPRVIGPEFVALHVRDLAPAQRFYTEQLGLTIDPAFTNPVFVTFATSPILFGISQTPPEERADGQATQPLDLWLSCDDADGLHTALVAENVPILQKPEETPFGRRFICQDPDGHILNIYQAVPLEQARAAR